MKSVGAGAGNWDLASQSKAANPAEAGRQGGDWGTFTAFGREDHLHQHLDFTPDRRQR